MPQTLPMPGSADPTPSWNALSSAEIEAGRKLFAAPWQFLAAAGSLAAVPATTGAEIAFAGRSNVGKSSLVNALTGRRMLARTSHTPGRTRQINFFDLGGLLMLVDLPGYGYADASKAAIKSWNVLVRRYLQTRATLRRACLLIDSRHGIKEADRPLMRVLDESGVSYQIVLTKTDKAAAGELSKILAEITAEIATHVAAHPEVHLTSSVDRRGITELHEMLAGFAVSNEKSGRKAHR